MYISFRDLKRSRPGSLTEVTTRAVQSRFLLPPSPQLNRIISGALARASRRCKVGVVAFVFLANHYLPLQGVWINRTGEHLARQKGETPDPQRFEEPETA